MTSTAKIKHHRQSPGASGQFAAFFLLRHWVLAFFILVAGIYLTEQAKGRQQGLNRENSQAELQRRLNRIAATVVDKITLYQYGLRGLRGSILSVGPEQYRLSNMQLYAQSRDIALEFPGARGFGFIRKVQPAQLERFLIEATEDRGEPFELKQLQPHQDDLFIIQYVEPYARNKEAIGLDIGSDPSRRRAALAAVTHNAATLTAPITLVQQAEKTGQGFLFLMPIFNGPVSSDPQQRYQQLLGWSYAPLLIDEILRPLADVDPDLQLSITDLASQDGQPFFLFPSATGETTDIVARKKMLLFGRHWLIEATASPRFIASLRLPQPENWLHYGIFVSVLLMMLTLLSQSLWYRRHQSNQQKSLLTAIVSNANEAIIGLNYQGQVVSWNAAATTLFGYSAEQALGYMLSELIVPPEQQAQEAWLLNQLMAGYSIHGLDTVRCHQQGRSIAVSINASPIDFSRDDISGFAVTIHDISQLKAAEILVRQHNQRLEAEVQARTAEIAQVSALQTSMLNSTNYAVIATDLTGIITAFNPAAELLLGYQAAELIGRQTPEIFHDMAEVRQRAEQLSTTLGRQIDPGFSTFVAKVTAERADTAQWFYLHKNGQRFRVSLTITALLDLQQNVTGYLGVAHDLTHQQQLEFELALAKVSTEQTVDLVMWLQQDGAVFKANAAMAMALGYSDLQLSQLHISQLLAEYDTQSWQQLMDSLRHTNSIRLQHNYRCFDGSQLPVSLTIATIELAEQRYLYLVARDIRLQLQKEAELAQAKELADGANRAKSSFLHNISHDLRNPIEQVLAQLRHLQDAGLNERQLQLLSATTMACGKLTTLLQDIADFSSVETGDVALDRHWVDLQTVFQQVALELKPELQSTDLELVFDVANHVLAEVLVDSQRLRQVLLYLTLHAMKVSRAGVVVLRLRVLSQLGSQLLLQFSIQHSADSSRVASLSSDSLALSPIPQESLTEQHQGLSLSICQRLVKLMGGEIHFEMNHEYHASRFALWLTSAHEQSQPDSEQPLPQQQILLVEPCQDSAKVLTNMAAQLGYHAELAVNAEQADNCLRQQAEHFQLVLISWRLPMQDGCQLAATLKQKFASLCCPIILLATPYQRPQLSGYWQSVEQPAVDTLLLKPCLQRQFELAFQEVLQAPPTLPSLPAQQITGRLSGLRLLLVDKNPRYRQHGAALLAHEGCTVLTAATGQQAKRVLADSLLAFDLVLLDLELPDADGFSVAASIRQQARYRSLPLVAMSVQPLLSDKLASLTGGLDDHVIKPFDIHTLVQVIIRLTSRQSGHIQSIETLATQWPAALQVFAKQQQLELETAVQRLGNSLAVYHKTLQMFRSELQQQLNWLTQTKPSDITLSELYWCCRKLRSTAAVLGLTELMQILRHFEGLSQLPEASGFATLRQSLLHWLDILEQLQHLTMDIKLQPTELQQQFMLEELQQLSAELMASDMHAVARFASIQRRLALVDAASTSQLDKMINQLDFKSAVEVVSQNIRLLQGEASDSAS